MSAAQLAPTRARNVAWVAVAAGLVLLWVRPYVAGGRGAPVSLQVVIFAALLAVSMAGPAAGDRSRVHPGLVLGFGVGVIWLSGMVVGTAIRPPIGSLGPAIALNSFAALAEEAFFRGFLYERLARWGVPVAVVVSAMLFALVHLSTYGVAAMPVDLGAGLLFGWQRWASGSWLVPAGTHAFANLLVVLR
jgi:membrane protease YdiL (CAAX protease family)